MTFCLSIGTSCALSFGAHLLIPGIILEFSLTIVLVGADLIINFYSRPKKNLINQQLNNTSIVPNLNTEPAAAEKSTSLKQTTLSVIPSMTEQKSAILPCETIMKEDNEHLVSQLLTQLDPLINTKIKAIAPFYGMPLFMADQKQHML